MPRSQATQGTTGSVKSADAIICIAGANAFNNEILSNVLESQTGLKYHCVENSNLQTFYEEFSDKPAILFLDCAAMGIPKACKNVCFPEGLQDKKCMVVCFNVDPGANLESNALKKGVRGIIYDHLALDQFPRAVKAVLDGELWYPREILEKHFLATQPPVSVPDGGKVMLTRREKEILNMLASGMINHDIARKLCISPHTVKTHAYNLYKKISVTNRFQAAQWLTENS